MLVAAPPAPAAYDPVAGGSTTIVLAPSFRAKLHRHGVRLVARGGARLDGAKVTFPVSGGKLDPVAARGVVEHAGGLVFVAGTRRLPLRGLVLKTSQVRSPLAAKFGGGKLKIASSSQLATARSGFGLRARVRSIALSGKVATRLGKKLRLHGVFQEGDPFGSTVTDIQPARVAILAGERATLVPAPAFLAKLNELFVSLNPIAPAELAPGSVFTFPIVGGDLAPDASGGSLKLGGSLEFLQLGGGQIFWTEPVLDLDSRLASAEVDFEPSPPHPGKEGPLPVLGLGGGAPGADPSRRVISLEGAGMNLTAETAAAFNEAFAESQGRSEVFLAGEAFGNVSFAAQAH
jgi:hypothetical protein